MARRIIAVMVLMGLGILTLQAQFGTGLVLDDDAYHAVAAQPDYGQKGDRDSIYKVDLSPYCPEVANQGPYSTCTGWAVGYGAYTIQRAIDAGWEGQKERITDHAYSALFLYNQLKTESGCNKGTKITEALELMKTTGNTFSRAFDSLGCDYVPKPEDFAIAQKHRIKDFQRLFDTDAIPQVKIHAIKQSLIARKPVIIGIRLRENFMSLAGMKWWFPELGNSPWRPAHALVIVGFDDGKGVKGGAFQLMNSFGTHWGDKGFCWVNYEDLALYCLYAFQLSTESRHSVGVDLAGTISCQAVDLAEEQVRFNPVKPILHGQKYSLDSRAWKTGDMFQLQVSGVTGERFLYVFSYDPDGEIHVHWPRDEKLDEAFEGKHESAIIISSEINLTLPEATTAFELKKAGLEQICLLFSPVPIRDLNLLLEQIQDSGDDLRTALYAAFAERILAPPRVIYKKKSIGFWASQKHSDKIVPVFIQMKTQ